LSSRELAVTAFLDLAVAQLETGNPQAAMESAEKAMEKGKSGFGEKWRVSHQRMQVLERMGDIYGNPRDINLCLPEKAIEAYEEGLSIAEASQQREGADVRARRDADRLLRKLSLMVVDKNPDRAIALCRRAVAISEPLVQASPGIPGFLRDLADGLLITGYGVDNLNRTQDALSYYERTLALQTEMRRLSPDSRRFRRDMEETLSSTADAYLKLGKEAEALRYYEKGREITVALLWDRPTDAYLLRDLSDLNERMAAYYAGIARRAGPQARAQWKLSIDAAQRSLETWVEWPRRFAPGEFAARREQQARKRLEEYRKEAGN
jgi:tetratricopeptide (TPR) repeat protein